MKVTEPTAMALAARLLAQRQAPSRYAMLRARGLAPGQTKRESLAWAEQRRPHYGRTALAPALASGLRTISRRCAACRLPIRTDRSPYPAIGHAGASRGQTAKTSTSIPPLGRLTVLFRIPASALEGERP